MRQVLNYGIALLYGHAGLSVFSTVSGTCYISSNSGWGFCFPYLLLTSLLSCRFRSGNPYRCNVLLFFWIIFSQWSMMSPRLFSYAHGYLCIFCSVMPTWVFHPLSLRWLMAIQSIFSFVADVKKMITKFTVKVSLYTFSKMLLVLFLNWRLCYIFDVTKFCLFVDAIR